MSEMLATQPPPAPWLLNVFQTWACIHTFLSVCGLQGYKQEQFIESLLTFANRFHYEICSVVFFNKAVISEIFDIDFT
jgi:hypothetical protein